MPGRRGKGIVFEKLTDWQKADWVQTRAEITRFIGEEPTTARALGILIHHWRIGLVDGSSERAAKYVPPPNTKFL